MFQGGTRPPPAKGAKGFANRPTPATKGAWAGKTIHGKTGVPGKSAPANCMKGGKDSMKPSPAGLKGGKGPVQSPPIGLKGGKGPAKPPINGSKAGKGVALPAPNAVKGLAQPFRNQASGKAPAPALPSLQSRISTMSTKLGTEADSIANSIMDLNLDDDVIRQHLERIVRLRSNVKMLYDQQAGQAGKGGVKEVKTKAQKRPAEQKGVINSHWSHGQKVNWKGLFQEWVLAEIHRPVVKGDVVYETTEAQDEDGKKVFFGKMTCMVMEDDTGARLEYTSDESATNIKDAEQLAAKVALMNCRPDQHDEAERQHQLFLEGSVEKDEAPAPKKAKTASVGGVPFADAKSKLNHGAQMLLGRAVMKGDVTYDVAMVEGSLPLLWVATVSLPNFDPETRFEGEACSDKKLAENSAAAKYLEAFADEIAEKKVERDARMEQKRAEREAEKAAKMEEEDAGTMEEEAGQKEEEEQNPYL